MTLKQLIWYSHVKRMDPTRLPKIIIHWKPEGRCQARMVPDNVHQLHVQQPYTYEKQEAASAVFGS